MTSQAGITKEKFANMDKLAFMKIGLKIGHAVQASKLKLELA